jgi:hypothetical protein
MRNNSKLARSQELMKSRMLKARPTQDHYKRPSKYHTRSRADVALERSMIESKRLLHSKLKSLLEPSEYRKYLIGGSLNDDSLAIINQVEKEFKND